MQITLNGEQREIKPDTTVTALVKELGLADQACAVEVNKALITKRNHDTHTLTQGDAVELVTLVGGG